MKIGNMCHFSNPRGLVGSGAMVVLQLVFIYVPVMNRAFHSAPISVFDWLLMVVVSMIVYLVVGLEKDLHARKRKGDGTPKTQPEERKRMPWIRIRSSTSCWRS